MLSYTGTLLGNSPSIATFIIVFNLIGNIAVIAHIAISRKKHVHVHILFYSFDALQGARTTEIRILSFYLYTLNVCYVGYIAI